MFTTFVALWLGATLLCGGYALGGVLSPSQAAMETTAFAESCIASYKSDNVLTEQGHAGLCRCTAARFFDRPPAAVVDQLQQGNALAADVVEYRRKIAQSCENSLVELQKRSTPGKYIKNQQAEATISTGEPVSSPQGVSLDGLNCLTDASGFIRCSNGVVCMRTAGILQCNDGSRSNIDSGGLTRFNDGSHALTDQSGLTRYSNGMHSTTNQSGLTRFSDGSYCQKDSSGLVRCRKP